MGTVTKVMFGLIILAGGGGIFMALSMIPEKVEALKTAKKQSDDTANAYKGKVSSLESDKSVAAENLGNVTKERDDYKGKYELAAKGEEGMLQETQAAKKERDEAVQARAVLSKQVKDIENLFGPVKDERDTLRASVAALNKKIEGLQSTAKPNKPKTKPVVAKATKSVVKNVDPKYGFITIPLSEKDTKKGDVYKVKRGGKFIGTIIVHAQRGASSYCKVDKTQTTGLDKNPITGDIKVGDDVELE